MMELKLTIGYNDLLGLIRQLPTHQIAQLRTDLNIDFVNKEVKTVTTDFQDFLLTAPVMDDEQYETFLYNRQHFNSWRTNLSV